MFKSIEAPKMQWNKYIVFKRTIYNDYEHETKFCSNLEQIKNPKRF